MSGPYREAGSRPVAATPNDATPWELRTWESERSCPVCAIPLFAASKDGYRIDACGKCGGSWMAHADVRRMIDTSEKAPIELARMADSREVPRPGGTDVRTCPECKGALVSEVLGGAEIDVCDAHGTWFDRTELQQVAIALLKEYGVARRVNDAEAERKRQAAEEDWTSVSLENVAIGVATIGLGLVGAAIAAPIQFDAFGREIEIDTLGREVLKRPR